MFANIDHVEKCLGGFKMGSFVLKIQCEEDLFFYFLDVHNIKEYNPLLRLLIHFDDRAIHANIFIHANF